VSGKIKNSKFAVQNCLTLNFESDIKIMFQFLSFQLGPLDIIIIFFVALFTGMAKTGVHGVGMITVPMLAAVFGGKLSSGIMLPLLVMADVMGVWYYHRHASWSHLKILFPWAAVGVIIGTLVGQFINDDVFRTIMAIVVVVSVVIMIWMERDRTESIPTNFWFGSLSGIAGGFTSMVGNLAGSVMALYLLSMRLPKNAFIGTAAWFFLVVNWFKVPFHVFVWHTISWDIFLLDLVTLPIIALGAYLGVLITKNLSEKSYRWFIIIMTLAAAVFMFV
jgi:uncharacterized membrane protein YfcA